MKCPKCKNPISEEDTECKACGHRILESGVSLIQDSDSFHKKRKDEWYQEVEEEAEEGSEKSGEMAITDRFERLERLGRGGMGEVFKVKDKLTSEIVALKIIRKDLIKDEKISDRFIQEIKSARKVNHPNVIRIINFGKTQKDRFYYTMDFIEGVSLNDLIKRKKLQDMEESIEIIKGICKALAAVHESGIIHRDLKPANIILDRDNAPHVCDFGIAKNIEEDMNLTRRGHVVGTPIYMSPEQLEGKTIDKRSDIYSLGIIMYQMLVGKPPFEAPTSTQVIAMHLNEKPQPPINLNKNIPHYLNKIILKCLKKEPENRFKNIGDLMDALENKYLSTESVTIPSLFRRGRWASYIFYPSVLLVSLLLAVNIVLQFITGPAPTKKPQFHAQRITYSPFIEDSPYLSPDLTRLLYVSNRNTNFDIFIQPLKGGAELNITRDNKGKDVEPVMSPDGNFIFFRSDRKGGGIFRVTNVGGNPTKISGSGQDAKLSHSSGYICYTETPPQEDFSRVYILDLESGESKLISSLGPKYNNHEYPNWSPDDKNLVFSSSGGLYIISTDGNFSQQLFYEKDTDIKDPYWVKNGNEIFFISDRGGFNDVWVLTLRKGSEKFETGALNSITLCAHAMSLYVSPDGSHVCFSDLKQNEMMYSFNMDSKELKPVLAGMTVGKNFMPEISPDGKKIAYISDRSGIDELWVLNLTTKRETQLTDDRTEKRWPTWSPDGEKIAFCSFKSGSGDIYTIPAEGGIPHRLTKAQDYEGAPHWSPDGNTIALNIRRGVNYEICVTPAAGGKVEILTDEEGNEYDPRWSPHGNLLLYVKDRNIMIMNRDGSNKKKLLKGGLPVFSENASYLYFQAEGDIWRVPFNPNRQEVSGAPEKLTDISSDTEFIDQDWKFSVRNNTLYFSVIKTVNSDIILLKRAKKEN